MYVVYGNRRQIKKVKEILDLAEERYDVTRFPEYLLCWKDPTRLLPHDVLTKLKVNSCDDSQYRFIVENEGKCSHIFVPHTPEAGNMVRIKSGMFAGLSGVVKDVRSQTCAVEFDVWGRLVKERFSFEELEIQTA